MEAVFPQQFSHLEKYGEWALPTERERLNKKCKTPMPVLEDIYSALSDNIDAIIAYLDKIPFAEIGGADKRLMDFACCFATFDISISGWRASDLADIFPIERWEFVKESW